MMLACGTYVYFTDGLAMTQNYISNFYDAISVPIVFYTILVAFMMDRLIRSDRQEEAAANTASRIIKIQHDGSVAIIRD